MRARMLITLFSISVFSIVNSLAQPAWILSSPSLGTTGAQTIPINYGINQVGTVYIVVRNFNDPTIYTSPEIRSQAIAGPSGTIVYTAALPVAAGNINTILQNIAEVADVSTTHTIYLVAETALGILQTTTVRLSATTKACPQIDLLTGFSQPVTCINKGPVATFLTVIPNPDPNVSGVLKGTQWNLDWGDGTINTFISPFGNDIPPLSMRTHTYTTVSNCNYVFSVTITNPCGEWIRAEYVAVVHGRDIPTDGDGNLSIVDNATGAPFIQVCEGNQTTITLRDNSTWNCQNPVLPGSLIPNPNTDPRNIEWLYGRDAMGAVTNTITGVVNISTLGSAPQTSGRISPIPYGSNSLSQTITIPATCQAGQYFRVYLKNWNKCNWADPEYVYTYVDIQVIPSPPAPVVPNKIACFGDNRTLIVTSPPVGTIKWYSDAALTILVAAGTTYVPPQTAPGVYAFWVVDESLIGQLCQSHATAVTLTIYPLISNNSLLPAPSICFATVPPLLTGTLPSGGSGIYTYQWESSPNNAIWTVISGATSMNYIPVTPLFAITYYRRIVMSGNCFNVSSPIMITVYPQLTPAVIGNAQTICSNTVPAPLIQINPPTGGTGTYTYQWQSSPDVFIWSNIPGAIAPTYIPGPLFVTTSYRLQVMSGTCAPVLSAIITITVYPNLTPGSIGSSQLICYNTVPAPFTQIMPPTGGMGIYIYQWQSSPDNTTWTNIPGATASLYTPGPLTVTTFYRRQVTSGTCGTVGGPSILITVFPNLTSGTIGNSQTICYNSSPSALTQLTPPTGGTGVYTYQWQNSPDNITWTNIAGAISQSYSPVALTSNTYYRRNVTSGPCGIVSSSFVLITVNPTPQVIPSTLAQTICNDGTTSIVLTSPSIFSSGVITFNYTVVVTGGVTGFMTPVTGLPRNHVIADILNNPTDAPQTVTYTIVPISPTGCPAGLSKVVVITVNPTPQVVPSTLAQTICNNGTTNVTLGSPSTFTTGDITFNYTVVATGGVTGFITPVTGLPRNHVIADILNNPTDAPQTVTYTIVPISPTGCAAGSSKIVVITVNPTPQVVPGTMAQTLCNDGTTSITLGSPSTFSNGLITFNYTIVATGGVTGFTTPVTGLPRNHVIADILNNPTDAPQTVTYTIVPISPTGCAAGPSKVVVITVNPTPQVVPGTMAQTICNNGATNVTLGSPSTFTSGVITFNYTVVATGGVTGFTTPVTGLPRNHVIAEVLHNPTNALQTVTYTIVPISPLGCAAGPGKVVVITVNPILMGGSIGNNQIICSGGDVTPFISTVPATGGSGAITYTWQYTVNMASVAGDGNWTNIPGSNSAVYDHGILTVLTKFIRRATDISCTTPVYSNEVTVTVRPKPVVDFSAIDPVKTNTGVPVIINGNPAGGSGIWTQHLWTGDTGPLNNTAIQNPTFISTVAGEYSLTYRVTDNQGCFGEDNLKVEVSVSTGIDEAGEAGPEYSVHPNPAADFVILKIKNYQNNDISYQLFNINGTLVQSKEVESDETMISISNLSSGTYYMKVIEKNKEVKVLKIIKE